MTVNAGFRSEESLLDSPTTNTPLFSARTVKRERITSIQTVATESSSHANDGFFHDEHDEEEDEDRTERTTAAEESDPHEDDEEEEGRHDNDSEVEEADDQGDSRKEVVLVKPQSEVSLLLSPEESSLTPAPAPKEPHERKIHNPDCTKLTPVIRRCPLAEIPLLLKKAAWKQLPVPDPVRIEQQQHKSQQKAFLPQSVLRMRRRVTFTHVVVRRYERTLGDNPSVSYGPPIQLDWTYEEEDPKDIDDFEDIRCQLRKPLRRLLLNYYMRMDLLMASVNVSEQDIKDCEREVAREKRRRGMTRYFLPYQPLEDCLESMGRKLRRGSCRAAKDTVL